MLFRSVPQGLARRCRAYYSTSSRFPIHPRLNYNYIASNVDAVQENMRKRNHCPVDANQVKQLYEQRNVLYTELSTLRHEQNQLSRAMSKNVDDRRSLIERAKTVKETVKAHENELQRLENELLHLALQIPNSTHPDVPVGPDSQARVLKTVGTLRHGSNIRDHVEIAQQLGILDLEQAALVSGSSFYYLQGQGAFLETALIQYAMTKAASKGYLGVITPDIVRTNVAYGCGFRPRSDESSQIYHVSSSSSSATTGNDDALCLVGTAEIPLAGKYANRVLDEAVLPQRLVGYGHAFRAEAGGRGSETKGLYRVHQFSKVELFGVTTPEQSDAMLDEFVSLQEEMFSELGLCFRILDMPTEELGASAYRKYDIEAWLPGRKTWGEISSTSNCTDYQARRLSILYRPRKSAPGSQQKNQFCHTVNGTAIAVPRIIIAILESFQRDDGTVEIPAVLRKWMPGEPSVLSSPCTSS